ncbi:MAG: polysaccharide biosynthesis C-terminal domain-containing protein [Chitinophagaceae bacterium]|nr:polysaccharide biosynthesis C-terminal domain-containing protein [Chitinophagaceae bacterium]
MWYGIPSILSRFIGYIMNFTLPIFFAQPSSTADVTQLYAAIPFLNILFTYGLETAYFRFSQDKDKKTLYNTLSVSLIISTLLFSSILYIFRADIANVLGVANHPEYINWMIWIVLFDALCTLAFAKLRQENRPRKYAFVRLAGIMVNFIVVIFFAGILPNYLSTHTTNSLNNIYTRFDKIDFYFIGNICNSIITFILLFTEFKKIKFSFNFTLWKEVMKYSYPLIIAGLGGMINDMLSRLIYQHVVNLPTEEAKNELGIFGNIFRLAVLITIMIQAFRMAAEPFFFNSSKGVDAQKTYARIMKFFVIACCFMFLVIGLYLDVFEWFFITINHPKWIEGLSIVPLLALGNIFLGIYYNLSIWYKLTNKNLYGAAITVAGAVLTIVLNIVLIPKLHYTGAAIATFCCYLFMMIVSYKLGQKYYPVPYAIKKLIAYIVLVVLIYFTHLGLNKLYDNHLWFSLITATGLLLFFAWFVSKIEAKELAKLPVIGKYFNK